MRILSTPLNALILIMGLITTLGLTGCGPSWVKPGTTPEMVKKDQDECELDAYRQFPSAVTTSSFTQWESYPYCARGPDRVPCSSSDNYRVEYYPRTQYVETDHNARPRNIMIKQCMQNRGYSRP